MSTAIGSNTTDEPIAGTADGHGEDLATAEFERAHTAIPGRPIGLLFDAEDGAKG